ncbi:uncharacterized protein CANTADRAFT_55808 [Suhomyces tanzawaensis NRRL Y-17324]|uniref:LicD/FKTN/FKRP nucleotidyltransferase domain-containing protein n=1 Tax=Suhomyces tanzawaensis NRRL Y-17324 TaxID=984487 RepID=A0A1E4SCV4_9ASCO|nr:uncharacterized protein CANTADRAFT_55808 [Suhomyces tanzawaensis NRRL Y-17324]ODV77323.1 hypothetical protein CANTADRAFT_55808 [Suhomyces tanzawaensis NRRL Y-17324]
MGIPVISRLPIKTFKLAILVILVVNTLYFAVYYSGDVPLLSINKEEKTTTAKGSSGNLEQKLAKLFKDVEENKDRYWLAHTELTNTDIHLQIKHFLRNDLTSSWVNRRDLFYDPRFTLSVLSSELKHQYLRTRTVKAGSIQVDLNKVERPKLPFNWADWMDLTILNEDLRKPMDERLTCNDIKKVTNNNPDPAYFCMNNQEYKKVHYQKLGYSSSEQLPGFIIHSHSSHEDRPLNDYRIYEAKSYAMTHLPNPNRVIILNGDKDGGTFEFDVDEENTNRLIQTDLVEKYLKNHELDPESIDPGTIIQISHITEFESLKKAVIPRFLEDEKDVHGMYRTLRQQKNPRASRDLVLSEDLFSPPVIADEIQFYEKKGVDSLSRQEKLYYDGLKECSLHDDSNEPTFFKMATIRVDDDRNRDREWGWHYDWRFFNGALNYDRDGWSEQELVHRTNIILDRLLRNWNRFAEEKGIVSWIMHGPLLSWYWDGLMFPFDLDIDIQMPMVELSRLALEYNQTLVVEDPTEGYGKFLIEVGTYIHNRGISAQSNHIDARFIDVDSGIYIDITGLSRSEANPPEEYRDNSLADIEKPPKDALAQVYNDRRKHFYKLDQLSPLRYSMMCGVPVFVPSTITNRLIFEYSNGLSAYEYNNWYFVNKLNLWIHKPNFEDVFDLDAIKNGNGQVDKDKLLGAIQGITDDQILKLLENDDILTEYYLTKELTDFHEAERNYLFDSMGKDNMELDTDNKIREEYNKLTSRLKMSKPLRKALYQFEAIERPKHHHEKQ